jgi:hypothetical protein
VLTGFLALSVHVVMLSYLMVPYPSDQPTRGWPIYIGLVVTALSLIVLDQLTRELFTGRSWAIRFFVLFVLTVMLRESLFRVWIMEGVSTTAWRFGFVHNLNRLFAPFLVCFFVSLFSSRLVRVPQKLLGALVIGSTAEFVTERFLLKIHGAWVDSLLYLGHDQVWFFPYNWHIQVPAYLSYAEPTIACFVVLSMIWRRLSANAWLRTAQFVLLVVSITGVLVKEMIYPFVSKAPIRIAIVGIGQFLLEHSTLAVLTAVTWKLYGEGKRYRTAA